MSRVVAAQRRTLRHEILSKFQGVAVEQIYEDIKSKESPVLTFDDLSEICDAAEVPVQALAAIFAPYRVSTRRIAIDKFRSFLDDEVMCSGEEPAPVGTVTDAQAEILAAFTTAVRTRWHSNVWVHLVRLNQAGTSDRYVRLATLCRLVDEYNLSFAIEDFIDAVFAFFGEKLDQVGYEQFAMLIQSFA